MTNPQRQYRGDSHRHEGRRGDERPQRSPGKPAHPVSRRAAVIPDRTKANKETRDDENEAAGLYRLRRCMPCHYRCDDESGNESNRPANSPSA